MKTLRFHTGRDGRFNNQGHVSFVKFGTIQDAENWASYFPTNEVDDWGQKIILDEGGNHLDYVIDKDGTGYISDDGEYDSDHWVKEDELNDKQIQAVKTAIKQDVFEAEELSQIMRTYYPYEMD